ncbi:MAG: hypothetical protein R3B06_18450 [Kofleriaceae bacterium]
MPESLPPLRCEIRRPTTELGWLHYGLLAVVVAATMVDVVAITAAREAQARATRARELGRYHLVLDAPTVEVRCAPAPKPTRVNDVLLLRPAR